MIQVTRALRRIASLKKRIWVIQGGQGAGKTFAILLILANHAASQNNKEIIVASSELSKMRLTVIKDFVKILRELGIFDDVQITDTLFRFQSGSFIKFIGLDKEDIGKGLRSDIVFINEANKVPFDTYRELTSRAKRVILDFNPNSEFWAHVEVSTRDDAQFLILTYKDNEFLSIQEVKEIERYKLLAYHDPNIDNPDTPFNIKSKYWQNKWHVYGQGIIGTNPNRIFFWEEIPDAQYLQLNATKYYGVDWGTVDPWGILEAKYYDGGLYLHELNYKSENQIKEECTPQELQKMYNPQETDNQTLVKWFFAKLGINKKSYIVCDNNRPMKILALHEAGYDYSVEAPKPPGSIIDGIDLVSGLRVYYTSSSKNIKWEQENYSRLVDRYGIVLDEPEDKNNHCFSGDTLIETIDGKKRIDSITYHDLVLTSKGYRKVLKVWDNGKKQTFKYSMQFDIFSVDLICTPDHLIKTDKGWIEISKLESGMTLSLIRHLTGGHTTSMQVRDILEKIDIACIGKYGSTSMERERKGIISTIRTAIRGITNRVTWRRKSQRSISQSIPNSDSKITQSGQNYFIQKVSSPQKSGMVVMQGSNGIVSRERKHGSEENIKPNDACIVARNIKPDTGEIQNIAITTAKLLHLERGERMPRQVYDLTVHDAHEYFANGILVHNCMDPTRYIVLFLVLMGIIKQAKAA
jgi:phage terminase large subunit